ncbi:lysine--tRNA ligase, partial [Patescibacteria group bacterium]|nr:lysine--tRNA ligase [Patescibacteria group bacterium]
MSAEQKLAPGNEKEERLKKLALLRDAGVNPYPATTKRDYNIAQFFADFKDLNDSQKEITAAGRLRSIRSHGNLSFANLEDASGKVQLAFSKKELGDESYKRLVKLIDISDFIEVTGKAFVTTRGENSLMASSWNILSKAIAPIPDAWYGLKDEDERYRRRYLDLLLNPETRDLFVKKALFWEVTRDFMKRHG